MDAHGLFVELQAILKFDDASAEKKIALIQKELKQHNIEVPIGIDTKSIGQLKGQLKQVITEYDGIERNAENLRKTTLQINEALGKQVTLTIENGEVTQKVAESDRERVKALTSVIAKMEQIGSEMDNYAKRMEGLAPESEQYAQLQSTIAGLEATYNSLFETIQSSPLREHEEVQQRLVALDEKRAKGVRALSIEQSKQADISTQSTEKEVESIERFVQSFEEKVRVIRERNAALLEGDTGLNDRLNEFSSSLNNIDDASSITQLKHDFTVLSNDISIANQNLKLTNEGLKEAEQIMNRIGTSTGVTIGDVFNVTEIEHAIHQMQGLEKATLQWDSAVNVKGQSFQRVNAWVKESAGLYKQVAVSINQATGEVFALDKGLRNKGDTLTRIIGKVAQWAVGTSLVYLPIRQMQLSIRTLQEMDTALTELSMVMDISRNQFQELGLSALEMASRFGRSARDALDAQIAFARAGFENYQQMAELSLMTQAAGQMNEGVASSYIIASNAAFGFGGDIERLTALIDAQNQVSNRHAVNLQFLADATRTVGNVMHQAGETTQTMTALLTTAGVATQRSGSEIGRAMRTVTLRLQQVRQAFEGLDFDIEGEIVNAEELSNAAAAMERLGFEVIRMEDGVETFATVSEVAEFLAGALADGAISATELRRVLDALAGQRQAEALLAVITNWEEYQRVMVNYTNATGSAMEEAMKAADSWAGRMNALNNAFVTLIASATDVGGVARGFINAATSILEALTVLSSLIGTVPGQILATSVIVMALTKSLITATAAKLGFNKATFAGSAANVGFAGSLKIATGALIAKTAAMKAFLLTNPVGWAVLAAGAIAGVVVGYNSFRRSLEENARISREFAQQQIQITNTLGEQIEAFDELNNRRLETQGAEETVEINQEILSLQEQIRDTIGRQAEEIDLVNGRYEEQMRILRQIFTERRMAELEDMRSAMLMAQQAADEAIRYGMFRSPAANWNLSSVGTQIARHGDATVDEAMWIIHQGITGLFNSLNADEQYEALRRWQRALNDATAAGENVGNALAWVQSHIGDITDSWDEATLALREYERLALEVFKLELQLDFPDIFEELFNTEHAEQSFQSYRDTILGLIARIPDDVRSILGDTNTEIALRLGFNIDTESLRENLVEAFREAYLAANLFSRIDNDFDGRLFRQIQDNVDELIQTLSQADLNFLLSFDDEGLIAFRDALNEVRESGGDATDAIARFRDEVSMLASEAAFGIALENLREQIELLQRAMDEQANTGRVSAETYSQIVGSIEEYSNLLTITNGNLGILNAETIEYINSLVDAAIHQGILNGFTYEMIGQLAEKYIVIRDLNDELDYLQASYSTVARALEEYNDVGYVSIDTFQALLRLSPEYLAALDLQYGQLVINEERVRELTNALKEEAIIKLQNAAASDIKALADGRVEDMSVLARRAVAELGNSAATAGSQMSAAAEGAFDFAAGVAAIMAAQGIDTDHVAASVNAIVNAYAAAAENIAGIRIDFGGLRHSSGRTPSNRSGGGTARAVEPYKAELEATMLLDKRLREIGLLLQRNNDLFNETTDVDVQANLLQERIDLLREQQSLLHQITNINRGVMTDGVSRLSEHGIRIQFNPELNKLVFEQTVQEMQDAINQVRFGDQEQTNELRRELESILGTLISMNDTNARNSAQWHDIQRNINQINMDLLNLDFDGFTGNASRELEQINFQLQMLAESDVDRRIELTTQRLEIQQSVVRRSSQEFENLQRALMDGRITGDQFRTATDNVTRTMQEATLAARQYAEAIAQIQLNQLNAELSAQQEIVNLTMRMIQQEARNEIDGLNRRLAEIQDRQNALRDIERQLNESLRDRNQLINNQIQGLNESLRIERERIREVKDGLNDELRRQRELARERQRALADDLRAFRELIEARRRELSRQSEDRRFEQDLSDRQLEVQRIQNRLDELANNDSMAARAERARLQEELARRQLDLDNLVFDNDIRNQDRALQDELDRFTAANQAAQDRIADELAAFERAHEARIRMIDHELLMRERNVNAEIENLRRQGEAFEAMINAQIEDLRRRGEMYDAQADRIRDQIADIQDRISRNGDLVRMAMQRIDEEGENLYKRLIEWNDRYGTGIREDISGAWEEYLRLVDRGNETTLDHTRRIMRDILDLQLQIVQAQHQINSLSQSNLQGAFTPGVRAYFESQGRVVDWHGSTNQFSVDGMMFDAGGFTNLNGRLQATYQQMLELERQLMNIPRYDRGGRIDRDQLAVIHADERVLNKEQNRQWESGKLVPLDVSMLPINEFGDVLQQMVSRNPNAPHWLNHALNGVKSHGENPSINIEMHNQFDGITTENLPNYLRPIVKQGVDAGINEYNVKRNNAAKAAGVTGRQKWF